MAIHATDPQARHLSPTKRETALRRCIAAAGDWLSLRAEHWAAAAIYQELSRLSDAELDRRGLSRATLARDICEARDRVNRTSGR